MTDLALCPAGLGKNAVGGKRRAHDRPDANLALDDDVAVVQSHDRLDDAQSQPDAFMAPIETGIELRKWSHQARQVRLRDADAGIRHVNAQPVIG